MLGAQFVKLIESRLLEIGMKKGDFYRLSGISSATMSQWRTGRYAPGPDSIAKVEKILGMRFEIAEKTETQLQGQKKPAAQGGELDDLNAILRRLSPQNLAVVGATAKALLSAQADQDSHG